MATTDQVTFAALACLKVVEQQSDAVDPAITAFYTQSPEEDRLERGAFLLEAIRTRELIERFAPLAPATVLDVGGAAGAYATWLADLGYTVHLIDVVPRLVAEARRRSGGRQRPLASCTVGDARSLDFPDASADAVLLLGPLYHLTTSTDRARAIAEAARVLAPGGRLFAAAISRWASALDGLARDRFKDERFAAIVEADVRDGQHRNPTGQLDYFTTAYFHRPDDLRAEVEAGGLVVEALVGIEGPGWLFPDIDDRLSDPRRRADLLRVARLLESEPSALGTSPHLMAIARKP